MSGQAYAIEMQGISKKIGKKSVVTNVDLAIKPGEIFGLLGPNGAGKTTMMRMMTGLIKPSQGTVLINGLSLAKHHEDALAGVGAIIESPDMYKHLSGKINLKMMANMSRDVAPGRIDEVVDFVGLSGRIGDKVSKYSLGMRQRLGIAAALLSNPTVLILDEPLNGLDPDGVKEMRETLLKLSHEQGVSVILSSHILSEMEQVCDRFAIIDQGILIETMELSETNTDENVTYHVSFLPDANWKKITEIFASLTLEEVVVNEVGVTFVGNQFTASQVIKTLVQADIPVAAVAPQKKSLEDYFIKRVGEVNR